MDDGFRLFACLILSVSRYDPSRRDRLRGIVRETRGYLLTDLAREADIEGENAICQRAGAMEPAREYKVTRCAKRDGTMGQAASDTHRLHVSQ